MEPERPISYTAAVILHGAQSVFLLLLSLLLGGAGAIGLAIGFSEARHDDERVLFGLLTVGLILFVGLLFVFSIVGGILAWRARTGERPWVIALLLLAGLEILFLPWGVIVAAVTAIGAAQMLERLPSETAK